MQKTSRFQRGGMGNEPNPANFGADIQRGTQCAFDPAACPAWALTFSFGLQNEQEHDPVQR